MEFIESSSLCSQSTAECILPLRSVLIVSDVDEVLVRINTYLMSRRRGRVKVVFLFTRLAQSTVSPIGPFAKNKIFLTD